MPFTGIILRNGSRDQDEGDVLIQPEVFPPNGQQFVRPDSDPEHEVHTSHTVATTREG